MTQRQPMRRQPIESSMIMSAGYDPASMTMEVELTGGAVYSYKDVPPEVHQQLVSSNSPGRFFNQSVRRSFAGEFIGKQE